MNFESLLPTVSLVVPCRNERQHIETCVRSLLVQEVPAGGYELLVVDGMSDDGTRDILAHLAQETSHLRVLDNPARITPCAMNLGIQAARGRRLVLSRILLLHDFRYALPLQPRPDARGSAQMIRFQGAHCPQDLMLMGVRWYRA